MGFDGIRTRILWINMHNVHVDKSKVYSFAESGTLFQGLSIMQPFNFKCRIRDRNNLALEMGPLALLDLYGFHGGCENGCLSCLFLLIDFVSCLFLFQSCELTHLSRRFRHYLSSAFDYYCSRCS